MTLTEPAASSPTICQATSKEGGKRQRKLKELTAMTDEEGSQKRIPSAFGEAEAEIIVGEDVKGLGMLENRAPPKAHQKWNTKLRERIIKKVAMSGKSK